MPINDSMHTIHPTAVISEKSQIGRNVTIGPYCVIEENVTIGDDTTLLSHAYIGKGTTIGKNNSIHMGAVIGHEAQNKSDAPSESFLRIGDHNVFREYVTVHRGASERSSTVIGDHNYFMAFAHVGHDSQVGNHVLVTNAVLLGGHVLLEDHSVLGGGCGIHQHCRIGAFAMIGGHATITKDIPPYMLVDDNAGLIGSMNIVGLRRAGFSEEAKREIKNAYKLLYLSGLNTTQALAAIRESSHTKEIAHLLDFIAKSKRGVLGHRPSKFDRNGAHDL